MRRNESGKSIKKNYVYNLIQQVLTYIAPLVTMPYVSRVLGASGVGTFSYAESITTYFVIFAGLGIASYGQREISYSRADIKKRSIVFWETKIISLFTTVFSLGIYIAIVNVTKYNVALMYVLSIYIIDVWFDVTWFFRGIEEFGIIVSRNIMFKILNIIYIFMFVKGKNDLIIYAIGAMLFLFLGNVSLWIYIPRYLCRTKIKD